MARIPWDRYEVAVLLDYCVQVEQNAISRHDAVSTVSLLLRERAMRNGIQIDEVFRNENGISMQMSAMRNCYLGIDKGLTISSLFREVVQLYNADRAAFDTLRLEEESLDKDKGMWSSFLQWLDNNYETQSSSILSAINSVSVLGRKSKAIKSPIQEIVDESEIEALIRAVTIPKALGIHSKKMARSASHALSVYLEFLRQAEEKQEAKEPVAAEESEGELIVDFSSETSYAHTKPIECVFDGLIIPCSSWNALFVALTKELYSRYSTLIPIGKNLTTGSRVDIGQASGMIYPKEIADGIYLECNISATGVVSKISALLEMCGVSTSSVSIRYRRIGTDVSQRSGEKNGKPNSQSSWSPKYTAVITSILTDRYPYGFRFGSPIELMKMRNYAEELGLSFPESDSELEKEIAVCGIQVDGKLYCISEAVKSELLYKLNSIFAIGTGVVFFDRFVEENEEWLMENHIASVTVLKGLLKEAAPEFYIGQNIITDKGKRTEHEATVDEILRVSEGQRIVVFSELVQALRFIPSDKIAWSLSASPCFARVSEGKYVIANSVEICEEDKAAILSFVRAECSSKGFASIADIPIEAIVEENYDLSIAALHNVIYQRLLKDEFYLRGKILTKEPDGVDIVYLLKSFCVGKESCTVSEVIDRSLELTGVPNRQSAFLALFDTMVRTESDRFIDEKQVSFDIEKIDSLLSDVVGNHYSPIKGITTFALFPTCGVSWNHYVLESFCYRFSKKYRLAVLNFNDKNAGIIVRNTNGMTYMEILINAVANAPIDLEEKSVGEYLFEEGYIAKRKFAALPEVIEQARLIRKEI